LVAGLRIKVTMLVALNEARAIKVGLDERDKMQRLALWLLAAE
jgi:hypothetical protein